MKFIITLLLSLFIIGKSLAETEKNIYEKIDLFSEVLNKIDMLSTTEAEEKIKNFKKKTKKNILAISALKRINLENIKKILVNHAI